MNNKEFDKYYEQALRFVTQGIPASDIQPPAFKKEYISEIKKKLKLEKDIITNADCLGSNDNEFWYHPDNFNHYHWLNYKALLYEKKFPQSSIEDIDTSTSKILKMICHPADKEFTKHGLVVGYVQSGKTANYTGLIAKAIDCGYKNIIILSGIHNNLRDQTQKRIEKDLCGYSVDFPDLNIQYLTSKGDDDFDDNLNPSLFYSSNPKISIIKKQFIVLEKLLTWFLHIDEKILRNHSTIIIDDEADNATIDVSVDELGNNTLEDEPYDDDPSKTNKLIKGIRNLFPKICYIGYTATPFANVLIDPFEEHEKYKESLYPRDFIISLPKPYGYTGIKELFPNLIDTKYANNPHVTDNVFLISENDHNHLLSPKSNSYIELIPNSLKLSFYHYLMSALVKKRRGLNNEFHSFLIHLSHEISSHELIKEKFKEYFEIFKYHFCIPKSIDTKVKIELDNFSKYWKQKKRKLNLTNLTFEDSKSELIDIINKIKILTVNSESETNLNFSKESNHKYYIIIGGNRLSRGLTIEGLTVTYFSRNSNYYDSFLQMGRWFGFRKNYEDLVMLFTTSDNYSWFNWLNNVEESMRLDIKRYDSLGKTPLELAVRIKTHPDKHVTSPLKMKNVIQSIKRPNYNNMEISTREFDLNPKSLQRNINETVKFINSIKSRYKLNIINKQYIWTKVSVDKILKFISKLQIPSDSNYFSKNNILSYIKETYGDYNELNEWSILLANNTTSANSNFNVAGCEIGLSARLKFKGRNESPIIRNENYFNLDLEGGQIRDPKNPLLIIHIIDSNSSRNDDTYEQWFKNDDKKIHLVGLVVLFPFSNSVKNIEQQFISAAGLPIDVN
jgi:hypothetical protein